ncbi:MAG: 50S ribosomal protein L3 N(5)-glutamine methyltransferase [Legionellaceae bacterium]|nr:50S ribosomal protein L3 N(5)-glutamine methyltransferase [Legionellaceae bacterium]
MKSYRDATASFETVIDFLRFGLSEANKTPLYYGHGTDNAWDDVLALVLGSLSLPQDMNAMLLHAKLTPDEKIYLTKQLEQRMIKQVPVPYLTNEAHFLNWSFYVDERVLIPRSPIAECIATQFTPWIEPSQVTRILDLGTGSGCIAIACCHAFPDALVDAVDVSREALEVAQMNRVQHGVEAQLRLLQSDCFDALPHATYNLIISNPPYVGADEMKTLPKEYQHEPELALYADKNGLAIVEKMLFSASKYLSEQGILVMEVGNSEEALTEAYPDVPFTWIDFESGGTGVFLLTAEQLAEHFKA